MLIRANSGMKITGRFQLELRSKATGELLASIDEPNMILDAGLEGIAAIMANPLGVGGSLRFPVAISIGDNGTLISDPFVPIAPPPTRTELYHEIGATRVGLDAGFTSVQTANAVECSRQFDSTTLLVGDFADATKQYLNEAMVWLGKVGDDPDVDWVPFAMRTFKSVPFGPVDAIIAVVRWTFTFERGTV